MNKTPVHILIQDYTYLLPADRIAGYPLRERDESKLLVYANGIITDDTFKNIASHLPASSHLILNNTKVIEARILFPKTTGATIEIFCLEPYTTLRHTAEALLQQGKAIWKCFIGKSSKWKPGQLLQKEVWTEQGKIQLEARYLEKLSDSFLIEFSWQPDDLSFAQMLHAAGSVPLPPYIKRPAESTDAERYQTIFARHQGSVAAPTAALHFTEQVFERLSEKNISRHWITLHVGAGTFKPVTAPTIGGHSMHAEHFQVAADTLQSLLASPPVVAVGTTTLRTLESLYWLGIKIKKQPDLPVSALEVKQWEAYETDAAGISFSESIQYIIDYLKRHDAEELFCQTSLIIVPGYSFQSARALITNFHQPQSTLLLLVAAFIGADWKKVYDHALANNYRFLSYGDSSLLFAPAAAQTEP